MTKKFKASAAVAVLLGGFAMANATDLKNAKTSANAANSAKARAKSW